MAIIVHEPDKNRLMITPSSWEEGNLLVKLPSRRWMKSRGTFTVPLTRQNCVMLLEGADQREIILPEEIQALLGRIAHPVVLARQWPADFPFRTKPFQSQLDAVHKLYNHFNVGALFMRPGSGKSYVAIALTDQWYRDNMLDTMVVLCPLTVTTVWAGEDGQIAKYTTLPEWSVRIWNGAQTEPFRSGMNWLIMGIESLSQGTGFERLVRRLEGRRYGVLVDESTRIKNHNKIRTQHAIDIGANAVVRLIATGTPATRTLEDLYAQFQFLDPNIIGIGDYFAFRNRYCIMGGFKRKVVEGYNHVDELMGLIEPYTFRCDKPVGLPPKLYSRREVDLTPDQRRIYNDVKNANVEGVSVASIVNRIAKLQQVVGGFLREDPKKVIDPKTGRERKVEGKVIWELPADKNPKIQAIVEWLDELDPKEQVIIWCKHLWEIQQLFSTLSLREGRNDACVVIVGATPPEARADIIKRFQAQEHRFFLGTQSAGGIGITLTAAHYQWFYSNTYSYEDRVQAEDRSHRIGQHNEVLYLDAVARKTVDTSMILPTLQDKMSLDEFVARKLDEVGAKRLLDML